MDFSGFDDPDFDADAWLNGKLNSAARIDEIENQVNQILARLQMKSRDISQATDQGIKLIYAELPQAMARMSQIGTMVNEVAESIRDLTNSGYKFKSGNIPDKIGELSSLKVRRDRLKEASEKLRNGVDFENQLVQLRNVVAAGELGTVCSRFEEVANAYETLRCIPKFEGLNADLMQLQHVIEKRLRPEMVSACGKLNGPAFSRCAHLAKQIQMEALPSCIVLEYFRESVVGVVREFDQGDRDITAWIQQCFDRCHEHVIKVSQWCLGLTPALFVKSIRLDFVQIVAHVVGPVIDKRTKEMLNAAAFDDLVVIVNAINQFSLSFPMEWNVSQDMVLRSSLDKIQGRFLEVLQQYLNAKAAPPRALPKSSTTGALNRTAVPSPSRSTDRLVTAEQRSQAQPFDKTRLSSLLELAIQTQEWIKCLSKDPIKCMRFVVMFIDEAIGSAIRELKAANTDFASLRDSEYITKFTETLHIYVFEVQLEPKLQAFLKEAANIGYRGSKETDSAFARLKETVVEQIVTVMSSKPLAVLKDLHQAPEWSAVTEVDSYDRMYDTQSSKYLDMISQHFLALIRSLSETEGLTDALRRHWMAEAARVVIDYYVSEIVAIPKISSSGRQLLARDVVHMNKIFSALGLTPDDRLEGIYAVLQGDEGKPEAQLSSDIEASLRRALK